LYIHARCWKRVFWPRSYNIHILLNKIKDHVLLNEVKKEYEILNETKNKNINFSEKIDVLYKNLKETNKKLWEIENKIRLCEKNSDFKEKFIQISRDIYFANDRRSKIKLEINKTLGSNIKEFFIRGGSKNK
jgi:predicted O-linked N-acetylglucosamine transferase (SPINDLY family)